MSQLLIERQNARANPAHLHALATAASTADVLKKYKELLDAGIISQEEFDAKEEQLLGL
jgi:predicted Zn-dependent peptidase